MQLAITADYTPVEIALTYRLGELELFRRRLRGYANRGHWLAQPVSSDCPEVPERDLPASFYFLPAHPVTAPPPPVRRRGRWLYYTPQTFRNFYVDLRSSGSFDAYLGKFSSKTRGTLRRKLKRFSEAGGGSIDFRVLRRPEEMDEFMRRALPLSERTYQSRLFDAGLPRNPEFAGELRRLAERGGVFCYLLTLRGRDAAYVCCFCRDQVATFDYVGFDPELRELSPGTVLQYLLLESMFAQGDIDIFDFTAGESDFKELFATDARLCSRTYVLEATLANRLSVAIHRAFDACSATAGALLERWRLKSRVKQWLRRSG